MLYLSTRGSMPPAPFSEILLGGLAPDGGLVVPQEYPQIDAQTLQAWRALSYPQLAFEIIRRYAGDIDEGDLRRLIERTYTADVFGSPEITPVRTLEDGLHLLQLSNGPTLAFKDVAMQLLGNLFEYVLEREGDSTKIRAALPGATGAAAKNPRAGKKEVGD